MRTVGLTLLALSCLATCTRVCCSSVCSSECSSGTSYRCNVEPVTRNEIECNDSDHHNQFLGGISYTYNGEAVTLQESTCVGGRCCNTKLNDIPGVEKDSSSGEVGFGETPLGETLDSFRCSESGYKIINETGKCERWTVDGNGWNFNNNGTCTACPVGTEYRRTDNTCHTCTAGTYSDLAGSASCHTCTAGTYSDLAGSASCTTCPRGSVAIEAGATRCQYCPSGYTTYAYDRNKCVGPQLYSYTSFNHGSTRAVVAVKVEHISLGSKNGNSNVDKYWGSYGNWEIFRQKDFVKRKGTILERVTLSNARMERKIRKTDNIKSVRPKIEDVYCYTNTGTYEGNVTKGVSGTDCIDGEYSDCKTIQGRSLCYCRQPPTSDRKPSCTISTGVVEECGVPKCNDGGRQQSLSGCLYDEVSVSTEVTLEQHTVYGDMLMEEDMHTAKIICDRLGMECTGIWRRPDSAGSEYQWDLISVAREDLNQSGNENSYTVHVKNTTCGNPYHGEYFVQDY